MSTAAASTSTNERRGAVLEVLQELLAGGNTEAVIALVRKLVARNAELERRLAEAMSRGHKNEGVSTAQLLLLLDQLGAAPAAELNAANRQLRQASGIDERQAEEPEAEPPKRQPPLRRPLPPGLRRVPNPIPVPAEERLCPRCGRERACIGHDETEVIDLIPAEVIVRLDRREKRACLDCEAEVVRAPVGDKVVPGGRMGTTLVSQLLVDKYRDGLPLHRQKERFERMGVELPISTLADQVTWATDLLRPVWRASMDAVLAAVIMHLDATGLPVLDEKAGGLKLGTLWGYVGDDETALYLYASTGKKHGQREGELGPADMLARRQGYTVADAAGIYDESFRRPGIVECGCNMHARRYFQKALDRGDTRAALPLAAFKKLYDIEEEIRDRDADERRTVRQDSSRPVYDELVAWSLAHRPHEPPSSPLGTAIRYLLNHEIALRRFLDDGVVPIDNGVVERLHIRAALTRKNFLFAGSDTGGERAAIAYSVLGSCELADVNPVEYLADVLPRLARGVKLRSVPELLPSRWKAARKTVPA